MAIEVLDMSFAAENEFIFAEIQRCQKQPVVKRFRSIEIRYADVNMVNPYNLCPHSLLEGISSGKPSTSFAILIPISGTFDSPIEAM